MRCDIGGVEVDQRKTTSEVERIVTTLLPRAALPGWFDPQTAATTFNGYATQLEAAIAEIYGSGFETSKRYDHGMTIYAYTNGRLEISYTIHPLAYSTNGQMMLMGNLMFKQAGVDVEQAGRLINKLMPEWLLAYKEYHHPQFQVFHSQQGQIVSQGDDLLQRMKISPKEGADFIAMLGIDWKQIPEEFMYQFYWRQVDVTKKPDKPHGIISII